jgi:hypothetical protein
MTNKNDNLRELAVRYKMTNDIPPHVQKAAMDSARKNLPLILKKARNYGLVLSAALYIFDAGRKIGLRLTIAQSKAVLAISAAISLTLITSGAYIIVKTYFIDPAPDIKLEEKNAAPSESRTGSTVTTADTARNEDAAWKKYDIGVFTFSGIDRKAAGIASKKITEHLKKALGPGRVTLSSAKEKEKLTRAVIGSVRTLGKDRFINAKVISVSDSRVEFAVTEKIEPENDIDGACERVSARIAEKIGMNR